MKISLTNEQVIVLHYEVKEILKEPVLLPHARLKFIRFRNSLENIITPYNEVKNDLIKEFGEKDKQGNIAIMPSVKNEVGEEIENKKFIDFIKKIGPISAQKQEIEFDLSIEDMADLKLPAELIYKFIE